MSILFRYIDTKLPQLLSGFQNDRENNIKVQEASLERCAAL